MKRLAGLAALLLTACSGETGVVSVALTTAPGSTVLDGVQTLRMTITSPHEVVTAERTSSGFDLGIDLPASGTTAAILVDGLDAAGNVVAVGASPTFAFGAVSGRVVIYMAAPDSVAVAPEALTVARSEMGTGLVAYGAFLVGGRLASGAPSDAIEVYNAFDHSLRSGMALPAPRRAPAVGAGQLGIYIFGGADEAGAPTANLWRFDPTIAPAGTYIDIGDKTGFARASEALVPLGDDKFLVTGTPVGELHGLDGALAARDEVPSLPPTAVTLTANDGVRTAIFVGDSAIVRFRNNAFDTLSTPGRAGATAVVLPGGKAGVVCGAADALRIDAASGTAETLPGIPAVARTGCAASVTSRHLVIAGGTTATGVESTVEVYDAATLAPLTTSTLSVPRTGALAIALPNDQVLIAGGVDAAGAPVATLELFTPAN